MNRRYFYSYLFIWLCLSSLTTHSLAQTITTGSLTPASICPGGAVTVTFTTTGAFSTTNTFSAQLSDAAGVFSATPAVIGSVTSASAVAIMATIPSSTANGSYKIRVVSSSPPIAGTPSAQALTVNVPTAPGTSPVGYCVGQSASALTAVPAAGGTLNWYTSAMGGMASSISPTPSTTAVGSTTYYVSQTVNGCESPRASLVVTVSNAPAAPSAAPAPTYCQNQSAVPLVATASAGATLNWYGTNQTGGTSSPTAPTPNTSQPGTIIYYVSQSVGACESSRTPISVVVNPAPAAPATTPSVTYCQNQPASPLVATAVMGATLNWYGTAQSGGMASTTATTPNTSQPGTVNYYVSQTLNGCESPRAAIAVTVNSIPGSPSVAPVSFCQNSPAGPLTATASLGGILNWYGTAATGGTPSGTAPTPPTSTVGAITYYVSQSVNGCEGPRTSIVVTVNGIPPAPTGNAAGPYCQGSGAAPLSATGANLLWYGTNAMGGNASAAATVPSTATPGSTTYYVTQTVNGCESARAGIIVTVKITPGAPSTSAVELCQGAAVPVLTVTLASFGLPNWYGTNPTSGTATATAPVPSNATVGTTTYYVSQTLDGCEGPRASLNVRVKAIPTAPGVAPISFCNNSPASQLTANGANLRWYDASDSPLAGPPTPGTGAVGDQVFKVSQTIENCESPKANLTVTIKALPAAPTGNTPGPYCQGSGAAPLSATGANLLWYGSNATGGNASAAATVPNTATPGSTTYYVTQNVNGCESARAGIAVTVKPTPGAPGTSAIEFCQGSAPPVLTATLVASATPNWYGTNPASGTATTTAPVPSNATPGTTTYYVSQTLDGCEGGRASLNVRVKALPPAPGVATIGFCNNATASQLTANGENLRWYDAADAPLGGAPTPGTGAVGDQVFKVSQTAENCEGPKANLTVTIKPLPGQPGVSNLAYCLPTQDQPQQNITPLGASGQSLRWFNTDGNVFPTAPTPFINQVGTQTYQVSQTVNGCEGAKATIQVVVRTTAAPTVAKPLVTYCINDKAVPFEATPEMGGSLRWIDPYGNVTNQAPTPLTFNTSIKPDGDPFYVYQIGQNGCYSERTVTKALVNATPTLALIAPVTNVNLGQRVALQLKFTSAAPYSYTLTDGYSGVSYRADTTISVLPRANTTYQVVTVRNSCGVGLPGNPATAAITVRVPTITTTALTASTLCAGTSLAASFTTTGEFNQGNAFRIELVSVADTSKKYSIPTTAATSPVTAPVPLTLVGGQYYVRVKADNPEIAITGSNSPTVLTVRPQPTATLTGTQNIYEGFPANLTLTFGGEGPWTVTYADSVRSYSATATASPYAVEVRPSRSTTYRLVSVTNGCGGGPVSGTATVTVLPLLGVDDNPLDPLVKTYPVPTTSTLTVELDLPLTRDPATLSLTDMNGRPVLQQTTRNRKQVLDLTAQPTGLYLLHIQVGDRQTVRKVLKQ